MEKARLSWTISGVRGGPEKRNKAAIMRSPTAYVGGYYWSIKFFPRGNNSSSLSVYVECSNCPFTPDEVIPETEFTVTKCPDDASLADTAPSVHLKLPTTVSGRRKSAPEQPPPEKLTDVPQQPVGSPLPDQQQPHSPQEPRDWRVSAEIMVVIYNPREPRTFFQQSASHQFNPNNVDWGWTSFYGPWKDIHTRQRGQRTPLLQNDTLAFDAYIRTIEDDTKALWWHSGDAEPVWPSSLLVGYRPVKISRHRLSKWPSFQLFGLMSWMLLAPFRDMLKCVDVLQSVRDSTSRPKPFCDLLVRFLYLLGRDSIPGDYTEDRCFNHGLSEVLCEQSNDVIGFWESLRRSLDLELEGTPLAGQLAALFDSPAVEGLNSLPKEFNSRIRILAKDTKSIQTGLETYLASTPGKWALPRILHVDLARNHFDEQWRQWQFLLNRIKLDEFLDLSEYVDGEAKYTLHGFLVREQCLNYFYLIVRPGGPGTPWLLYDAEPEKLTTIFPIPQRKVFCEHEGVDDADIDKNQVNVAVAALYVRNDVVPTTLTGKIDKWDNEVLNRYVYNGNDCAPDRREVELEIYHAPHLPELNLVTFDVFDLLTALRASPTTDLRHLTVLETTRLCDLRAQLARWYSPPGVDSDGPIDACRIRLWALTWHHRKRKPQVHLLSPPSLAEPVAVFGWSLVRLWVVILPEGMERFGMAEPDIPADVSEFKEEAPAPAPVPLPAPTRSRLPRDGQGEQGGGSASDVTPVPPPRPSAVPVSQSRRTDWLGNERAVEQVTEEALGQTPEEIHSVAGESDSEQTSRLAVPDQALTETREHALQQSFEQTLGYSPEQTPEPTLEPTTEPFPEPAPERAPEPIIALPPEPSPEQAPEQAPLLAPSLVPEPRSTQPIEQVSQQGTQSFEQQSAEPSLQSRPPKPSIDFISPIHQRYYFLSLFDPRTQSCRLIGAFFAASDDSIKSSVRAALNWPESKGINVYCRSGVCVDALPSHAKFSSLPLRQMASSILPDVALHTSGSSLIACESLSKTETDELTAAGNFPSPKEYARYEWALRRRQPISSFTGKMTIHATHDSGYYSGDFLKGHFHGTGTHISPSGTSYTGSFAFGKRHGTGTMQYPNSDTYTGDWAHNERHGHGTYVEAKTGNRYEGGFRDGKRHGCGVTYWEVADDEADMCQICYGEKQNALFYRCGHVCACMACASLVDVCPMCRKKVVDVVRVYAC